VSDQLAHLLRLLSTIACCVVLAAFALWASDEGHASTSHQVAQVDTTGPAQPIQASETRHGGIRGAVEDANAALTAPFDGAVGGSGNAWLRHAIPMLLALLTYGLLARILIAYIPQRR
jgi:hypothetical protein